MVLVVVELLVVFVLKMNHLQLVTFLILVITVRNQQILSKFFILYFKFFFIYLFLILFNRIITNQIHELTTRIDNLETTLKKDVRTILDILHQQQQVQMQIQMVCTSTWRVSRIFFINFCFHSSNNISSSNKQDKIQWPHHINRPKVIFHMICVVQINNIEVMYIDLFHSPNVLIKIFLSKFFFIFVFVISLNLIKSSVGAQNSHHLIKQWMILIHGTYSHQQLNSNHQMKQIRFELMSFFCNFFL